MSIKEQLRRIIKVIPHFPIQTITGLAAIIIIPVFLYRGTVILTTSWELTTATPSEFTNVQERIREDEPDFFYKIYYSYNANDEQYITTRERSFRTREKAESERSEEVIKPITVELYYDSKNPNNSEFEQDQTFWQPYFLLIPIFLGLLAYFRWLMLKYYELEIEE